ncbi:MAG: hypothetical protein ACRD0B_01670 [Acidimicrobiales bacterium]
MDETEALEQDGAATPIFSVYRRGYDPDQVDRYVQDQQRRLDDALHRSSEAERKLAAAVGQLRELHRRVAVYESEARNQQPPQLDTLGERVQRILQEAWEGAYNLRQEAEREVGELRDTAAQEVAAQRAQAQQDIDDLAATAKREATEIVEEATRRALHIRDETERRRQAYLERVERDRENAVAQITYLYDQRQGAIAELARLQATVEATIAEMVRSPLGRPAPGVAKAAIAPQLTSPDPGPAARGLFDADDATLMTAPMGDDAEATVEERESAGDDLDIAHGEEAEEVEERLGVADPQADIPTGPIEVVGAIAEPAEPAVPTEAENGGALFDGEEHGWK